MQENDRGVIAATYHDLQSLSDLKAARDAFPLPKATPASVLKAVLQASEVALLNIADLLRRAAGDLSAGSVGDAATKIAWVRSFHAIQVRLSLVPHFVPIDATDSSTTLAIEASPGFAEFLDALQTFDRAALAAGRDEPERFERALADGSLDDPVFRVLHLARVANHEALTWQSLLAEVRLPVARASYAEVIAASDIHRAVFGLVLTGDTFFTQFRALHQIPEILCAEANDMIEAAIRDLRESHARRAAERLRVLHALTETIVASVSAMADNLATSDYHRIRENLGVTSGAHSIALHYHLFGDLYEQFAEELRRAIERRAGDAAHTTLEAIRLVDREAEQDADAWALRSLVDAGLALRSFVHQWRAMHLHLPRNVLGGAATRSLTGSPDAVETVRAMQIAARAGDSMKSFAAARGLRTEVDDDQLPLTRYIRFGESLDAWILATTGKVTRDRFTDVQQRLGMYAGKTTFTPPPRRRV